MLYAQKAAMGDRAGGTTSPGQVDGDESLSRGCLNATYDPGAGEIEADRPRETTPERWLQIRDPRPWNADICDGGAVYWEDWSAVTQINWIYFRHGTSQH